MKLNAEKCEFLITGFLIPNNCFEHLWLNIEETQVWEKNQVKLLGITIDNELKFDDYITKICCKDNSKLSTLSQLTRYLPMEHKKLLYMLFIEAQFKYCPLKLVSTTFYQVFIFSPNDSPSKNCEKVFYFIKKALFILEIFKFLYFFLFLSTFSRFCFKSCFILHNPTWSGI